MGGQGREKKSANAPMCEVRFAPINDIVSATRHVRKVPATDNPSRIAYCGILMPDSWMTFPQ